MKKIRLIVSLFLAMLMAVSFALPAFAAGASQAKSGKTYKTVTLIGDSLATGYMIKNDDGTYVDHTHGARIEDAWTSLVADGVGAVQYNNYAREGSGTNEILRLLDPDFVPDSYFTDVSNAVITKYFDGEEEFAKYQKQIRIDIKNSDLILLNGGSNDLFATINTVARKITTGEIDSTKSQIKKKALAQLNENVMKLVAEGQAEKAWATVYQVLATLNLVDDAVEAVLECAYKGYMNFQKNWPKIAKKIHEINPDAKVVVVSLFNGAAGLGALPGTKVGLGKLLDPMFNGMNLCVKSVAASTHYYTFVDIRGVDTEAWPSLTTLLSGDFYDYMMRCTHPTKAGHKWIANKVLKVI